MAWINRVSRTDRTVTALAALALATALASCTAEDPPGASPGTGYEATVIRTSYGIPHITADSWGSLGFGEAYAAAEDQVCNMALALLQARGESARFFGPGEEQRNVARDIVVKALGIPARAEAALEAQAPDIREWLEGYAAGYNRYLAENPKGVGSWCDNAGWVRPVETREFMAQYLTLVLSLPRAAPAIVAATLPAAPAPAEPPAAPALAATLEDLSLRGMGSNAWALAGARTENGRGLLLANPHYPWYGIARFWEKHLTIPGVYDAYGAGVIGTPGVSIGFNDKVGWSHTVSNSKRTVIYRLRLNPANPREYRRDDAWEPLSSVEVSVDVLRPSGLERESHRIWSSHHGPLIALAGLSDDPYTVFAIRDANAGNIHTLAQWQAMGQARDMDAFIDAHRRFNAMPWVNTIATSADGRAVYIDNSTVGALGDETIGRWRAELEASPKLQFLYLSRGLVILDGSETINDWRDTDAPVPNTEPFDRRPLIESAQYVFNANDSYWLSDPANPAAPYSPLYGATDSPRSVRTRMNMELLHPENPRGYAGDDGKLSIEEVQAALFGNDSLTADLLIPDLLAACAESPERRLETGTVDLAEACGVLGAWDRKLNRESRGAVLFREWLTRYPYTDTYLGGALFAIPFDPDHPGTTPRGLADPDTALDRLAEATRLLTEAGIALDTPLGDQQIAHRMGRAFPVHGGNRREGVANLQTSSTRSGNPAETPVFTGSDTFLGDSESLSTSGYNVVHGSSFIMTLSFTDRGPRAEAILSYAQSGDPESEHFSDQTELYRDKRWRPVLFAPEDIEADARSTRVIRSP